jgi:hypothetical protein
MQADTLEDIDSRVALLLKTEEVLVQISRENPGLEDLIAKIAVDQFPRVNSRYKSVTGLQQGYLQSLRAFREQFYNIIAADVREARIHNTTRQQFNTLAVQCPVTPAKLLHSDAKYEESLSFFQYHGYTTGFEGGLLESE